MFLFQWTATKETVNEKSHQTEKKVVISQNGERYHADSLGNDKLQLTKEKTNETEIYDLNKDREKLETLFGKDVFKQILDWVRQQEQLNRTKETQANRGAVLPPLQPRTLRSARLSMISRIMPRQLQSGLKRTAISGKLLELVVLL